MQDIYQTFEFQKIRDKISEYSKTELGRENIANLVMFDNINKVKEKLLDLNEVISIILRFGPFPIANSANALKLIDLAKKTGLLTPRDLSLIAEDVITLGKISAFINKIDVNYPRSKQVMEDFCDLNNLEKEIHRVITPSLTIADNATPELKEIRGELKKVEAMLDQKIATLAFSYSSYLNDDNATLRDGHFVLPVKTVDKSKVPGIIYDVSDSGATTFIEPLEIVQINNKITSLKVEENEEIRKILKGLTALVLLQENEIITNNKIIAHFDFLSAKAMYANEINAEVSELSDEQMVLLEGARHPLIDAKKVVSNSFYLDQNKRIIIISGPNAGGKTVSLKTVGVLILMNQCGLAIPANKAKLGYFKHIYIDIGDNQSLSDNLSTFSAHVKQLGEILDVVGGKDIVLFDELGTGTDPREGEALAFSVTKFLESKHNLAMISSHFNALKEYAFISPNLDNASMIFDEEKLLPTYRFRQSAPGHSYALDVASRYGIKKDILDDARKYLKDNENGETALILDILQKKLDEATKLEDELNKEKKQLEYRIKKLENDEKVLLDKRATLLKDVKEEKEHLIEKAKQQIDEILKELNKENVKVHEVIELKRDIEDLQDIEEEDLFDDEIRIGDYVIIPSLNLNGKVVRINGDKAHIISDSGLSFDSQIKKLHKTSAPKVSKKVKTSTYDIGINTHIGLECNLIGKHVEEGVEILTKYLDNCRLKHLTRVRIIHGFGSGALRNAVRKYLDTQKDLSYQSGGEHEGGGGCTVVIFND